MVLNLTYTYISDSERSLTTKIFGSQGGCYCDIIEALCQPNQC